MPDGLRLQLVKAKTPAHALERAPHVRSETRCTQAYVPVDRGEQAVQRVYATGRIPRRALRDPLTELPADLGRAASIDNLADLAETHGDRRLAESG